MIIRARDFVNLYECLQDYLHGSEFDAHVAPLDTRRRYQYSLASKFGAARRILDAAPEHTARQVPDGFETFITSIALVPKRLIGHDFHDVAANQLPVEVPAPRVETINIVADESRMSVFALQLAYQEHSVRFFLEPQPPYITVQYDYDSPAHTQLPTNGQLREVQHIASGVLNHMPALVLPE